MDGLITLTEFETQTGISSSTIRYAIKQHGLVGVKKANTKGFFYDSQQLKACLRHHPNSINQERQAFYTRRFLR